MKNILFYSSDIMFSNSFLIYLQNNFNVTITTNIDDFKLIFSHTHSDIIIMDIEPSNAIEIICKDIHNIKSNIPILLTYVFNNRIKDFDERIRKYVRSIFYKPIDIAEITNKLDSLALKKN